MTVVAVRTSQWGVISVCGSCPGVPWEASLGNPEDRQTRPMAVAIAMGPEPPNFLGVFSSAWSLVWLGVTWPRLGSPQVLCKSQNQESCPLGRGGL